MNWLTDKAQKLKSRLDLIPSIMNGVERVVSNTEALLRQQQEDLFYLRHRLDYLQEALGRVEARQLQGELSGELWAHEFRAFSQWGEDGIIQFLIRHVPIPRKIFIEFGVEDYTEANTRFLLTTGNWSGLVLDSSDENVAKIRSSLIHRLYDLTAVPAFVTRDNINQLLRDNGMVGEIGLLSIDIDGNDYWIWEAITVVNPAIVVIEYNYRFGPEAAVTIPYEERFDRTRNNASWIYFGASLKALCLLAERKGYCFVGCNSNGVNAFFVRRDRKPETIKALLAEEGYVEGRFSEFHNHQGEIVKISQQEQRDALRGLPLVEVGGREGSVSE